jgi:hypothetical protein
VTAKAAAWAHCQAALTEANQVLHGRNDNDGQTRWDWAEPAKVRPMRTIGERQAEGFHNDQVVFQVVRNSHAASVVTEVIAGHRPTIWVSDLCGAQ